MFVIPDLIGNPLKAMKSYYVYILTNYSKTVLYIGVTNNLVRRFEEHKFLFGKSFAKRYKVDRLVYYEEFSNIKDAIYKEKQLKHWNRNWKNDLITGINPQWDDLSFDLH